MANPTKSELISAIQTIADNVTTSTTALTDTEAAAILNGTTEYITDETVFPNVRPKPTIKF